jgi:hypothetical protein
MTANISSGGSDLDTLFAAHVTNNAASATNFKAAGTDIQSRFDPIANPDNANAGARSPAIGITSAGTDLASIFCGNAALYSLTVIDNAHGGAQSQAGWTSPKTITHTLTVTFASGTALSNYFFYGGRIILSSSQTGGTVGTAGTADDYLNLMMASMGNLVVYDQGHYRTGTGGTISNAAVGGANVTSTSTALYSVTDGGVYSSSTYSVSMVLTSAAVLTITMVLSTPTAPVVADTYSGTFASNVSQRNYPAQSTPTFSSSFSVV